MNDALRDVVRHGTAFGAVTARNFPAPAGGKTGTTNDGFDVWFIGFMPDLVTGVWIGFDQPKKIKSNAQGGILAAPAWTAMMKEVYDRRPIPAAWPRPKAWRRSTSTVPPASKQRPSAPRSITTSSRSFRARADPVLPGAFALQPGWQRGEPNGWRSAGPRRSRRNGAAHLGHPGRDHPRAWGWTPGRAGRTRRLPAGIRVGSWAERSPTLDWRTPAVAKEASPLTCPPCGSPPGGCCRSRTTDLRRGRPDRIGRAHHRRGSDASVPRPDGVPERRASDAAIVPGFVNAHTHLELTDLAGQIDENDFSAWIRRLRELKERSTAEQYLAAAKRGLEDCWAAGVTTVADTGDRGVVIRALAECGGSGIVYQEVFGPHPNQAPESVARLRATLADLRQFESGRVRLGVSPHAPYTVSGPLYRSVAEFARSERLPVAVHLANRRRRHSFSGRPRAPLPTPCRRDIPLPALPGRSPVAWLEELGCLASEPSASMWSGWMSAMSRGSGGRRRLWPTARSPTGAMATATRRWRSCSKPVSGSEWAPTPW